MQLSLWPYAWGGGWICLSDIDIFTDVEWLSFNVAGLVSAGQPRGACPVTDVIPSKGFQPHVQGALTSPSLFITSHVRFSLALKPHAVQDVDECDWTEGESFLDHRRVHPQWFRLL